MHGATTILLCAVPRKETAITHHTNITASVMQSVLMPQMEPVEKVLPERPGVLLYNLRDTADRHCSPVCLSQAVTGVIA